MLKSLLQEDVEKRMTAEMMLADPWLSSNDILAKKKGKNNER